MWAIHLDNLLSSEKANQAVKMVYNYSTQNYAGIHKI